MGAPSPAEPVRTLGKYTLLQKLGEGYLGPVYRGFDESLDRAVAVRILCDGIRWDPGVEELFHQQCRTISGLSHPGIASTFDSGKEGESYFVVMESLGGASLEQMLALRPEMTVEAKISAMIQVGEGLAYAHKNGVEHRDLAPAKIHMLADGTAKIRDFGIAHILRKHLPHPAIRWGSPIYLSPEQVQQRDCDRRSDIFSAGTIFYELLTFRHPFFDRDGNKALDNILLKRDIPTFEIFPDAPPGIWPILKTCLEKNPKDRFQSMDEFADACKCLLKDLGEDVRLMLAELYAAHASLKIAASKPDASASTLRLLKDIQNLLSGEKQADYASLDRLMTVLLEQHPVIRAAAGALLATDPADIQLPPEEVQAVCADETSEVPSHVPAAAHSFSIAEQISATVEFPNNTFPAIPQVQGTIPPARSETYQHTQKCPNSPLAETPDIVPVLQTDASPTTPEDKASEMPSSEPSPEIAIPEADDALSPARLTEELITPKAAQKPRYRKIRMPSYRTAAALLALLVIAAAAYIVWGSKVSGSMGNIWKTYILNTRTVSKALAYFRSDSASADTPKPADTAQIHVSALPDSVEAEQITFKDDAGSIVVQPPQNALTRISAMIDSGNLQRAQAELDKLQKTYPGSSRIAVLQRKLQAKDLAAAQEKRQRDQQQLNAALKQKEEEWNSRTNALFADGKYTEAENAINLWLAEFPGDWSARELGGKVEEIQRNIKTYTAAMAENRYQEAISAIGNAERMNPADSNLAELRKEAETRKANAKAMLTVYRLGPKGVLYLDGRPISNDGEVQNSAIPIGSHLITIENGGNLVASRRMEFLEGQRIMLVHDLGRKYLRFMADNDRELIAQRKSMEEVRFFEVEHLHGTFRGSCHGILAVDYLDIAFKPTAGYHGFRMPFRLLSLRVNGKSIQLLNVSDNSQFQSFKLDNDQAAEKFRQSWDELKDFARQVAERK